MRDRQLPAGMPECGALSARRRFWQSPLADRAGVIALAGIAIATALAAVPADAVPGGALGTLETGKYYCELPGDASGPVGRHVPEADFRVISASSYEADGKIGSYLLTGERVTMTSGPRQGRKFHRVGRGFLRAVEADGSDGALRCVRQEDSHA